MAENFRDNEARERFELDVEGTRLRHLPEIIRARSRLVHTEVPPELGGKASAQNWRARRWTRCGRRRAS
jgi:hypothetical protein